MFITYVRLWVPTRSTKNKLVHKQIQNRSQLIGRKLSIHNIGRGFLIFDRHSSKLKSKELHDANKCERD